MPNIRQISPSVSEYLLTFGQFFLNGRYFQWSLDRLPSQSAVYAEGLDAQ